MALRNLGRKEFAPEKPLAPPGDEHDLTLVFAFDKGYLIPFKVMLHNMYEQNVLLDCPIKIYTDDERILADPVVNCVAEDVEVIREDRRKVLYELARDTIKRKEKADWNRGTFLKWAMFEEQKTSAALFLDVDMLILGSLEPLVEGHRTEEVMRIAPQFQASLVRNEERRLTAEESAQAIDGLVDANFEGVFRQRMNSGVMMVGKPLLTDKFFDEATAFARTRMDANEQGHLSEFFRHANLRKTILSVIYNFQENYSRFHEGARRRELIDKVRILHYAGSNKPWKIEAPLEARDTQLLWTHAYHAAHAKSRILA